MARVRYLKSGRFRDKNDVLHVFVASVLIFFQMVLLVQCSLVIVALVIVDSLIIVDKTAMTEFLLSNFSRYSGFSKIS